MNYKQSVEKIRERLLRLPQSWDGKECILELKDADYNWKQMEWLGFYFEFKARELLEDICELPGDRINNVTFDLKMGINFDLKSKAINSRGHRVILNDVEAMNIAIENHNFHGEIIALCNVEYDDANRTFQKWHSELKGGLSAYEKERRQRTSTSRDRKTKAELCEIIIVKLNKDDLSNLGTYKQGINSNGKPRPEKYMLNLTALKNYEHDIIKF